MSAYDTVRLRLSLAGLSVATFGCMAAVFVSIGILYRFYPRFMFWLRFVMVAFPFLSLIGLVSAALAMRRDQSVVLARWGLLLNATVLLSCVAAVAISAS